MHTEKISAFEKITGTVKEFEPNDWNPNKQSDFMQEKTRNSIEHFGFLDPIVVREHGKKYQIIDGYHRWKAAGELDVPITAINIGQVSDIVAKQLTVILNETRGEFNEMMLAELVADLVNTSDRDLLDEILPMKPEEIDVMVSVLDYDFEAEEQREGTRDYSNKEELPPGWVDFPCRMPKAALAVIQAEINRVADIVENDPSLPEKCNRGLIVKEICLQSASTPKESLK